MLKKMLQAWWGVEGKKTKFGMILLGLSLFMTDPVWKQALETAGAILGGVGIGDWAARSVPVKSEREMGMREMGV